MHQSAISMKPSLPIFFLVTLDYPYCRTFLKFSLRSKYRGGSDIKEKMGSIVRENGFCVFSKTNSLLECVIVGGKRKKHSKSPNFVQLKTHQRMCSDDENQF